jgi:hypothetical protein
MMLIGKVELVRALATVQWQQEQNVIVKWQPQWGCHFTPGYSGCER